MPQSRSDRETARRLPAPAASLMRQMLQRNMGAGQYGRNITLLG
jgi:hypothetical protein